MSHVPRGKIHNDPYMVCGGCERESLGLYPVRPGNAAKELGWRYTRDRGWVCPECLRKKSKKRGK